MNPHTLLLLAALLSLQPLAAADKPAQDFAHVRPTRNVILMIPDGCSLSVLSAARWYRAYNRLGPDRLATDPYLCGTVRTYSSNAPIGDSAPTTSCYMTGYLSQAGNVAVYPEADPGDDLVPVDTARALQPLATVLEAAKIELGKATGIVSTLPFTHATPADCTAHHYNRGARPAIAAQIAANKLDIVFGAGVRDLSPDIKAYMESLGTEVLTNDIKAFRRATADHNLWALFADKEMPYALDRDTAEFPTLEEMTVKAIERLDKSPNGFFLMVEGSKVDWAGHANDAAGIITEYLDFDKAVAAALDFARRDGQTTVVVLPDHGNGGFAIGQRDYKDYTERSLDDMMATLSGYTRTGHWLQPVLQRSRPDEFRPVVKKYLGIDLTDKELETLLGCKNYAEGDYTKVANSANIEHVMSAIMNSRTPFAFTTGGHTGEEVFLAVMHPQGDTPHGVITNRDVNSYLCAAVGLPRPLDSLTAEIFAPHTSVFRGMKYSIDTTAPFPTLRVSCGKHKLAVRAFSSAATIDGRTRDLGSVAVYVDKRGEFYLPRRLRDELQAGPKREARIKK